jgi:hypothetical protein
VGLGSLQQALGSELVKKQGFRNLRTRNYSFRK